MSKHVPPSGMFRHVPLYPRGCLGMYPLSGMFGHVPPPVGLVWVCTSLWACLGMYQPSPRACYCIYLSVGHVPSVGHDWACTPYHQACLGMYTPWACLSMYFLLLGMSGHVPPTFKHVRACTPTLGHVRACASYLRAQPSIV